MEFTKWVALLSIVTSVISDGCDKNKCSGPYTLQDPIMITNKVEMTGVAFNCEKLPTTVKMFTGTRRMHYSIVVNPIFGSTYQKKEVFNLPPSNSELDIWYERKQWAGGKECTKDQYECWATNLPNGWCANTDTSVWYNGKKSWNDFGVYWTTYGVDTCIKSWEGDFKESDIRVYYNANKEVITYQSGWESIKFNGNKRTYVKADEKTNVFFDSINISVKAMILKCMKYDNFEACTIPSDPWFPAELHNSMATVQNGHLYSHGLYCTKVTRGENKDYGHPVIESNFENVNPEFKIIIDSITSLQMRQMYNQMELIHGFNQQTKIINSLISSLSKIDDELIGKIYGLRSKTLWFNPDVFYTCPCYQYSFDLKENCGSNHIYNNGRIIEITDSSQRDMCLRLDKNVTNVKLVDQGNYNFEILHVPPPDPDPSIWAGWTWISSTKDQLNDLAYLFGKQNKTTNPLGWFSTWDLSELKLAGGFMGLSSIATWIVIVMLCVILRK